MVEQNNIPKEEWLMNLCDNQIDDEECKESLLNGNTSIESYLSIKWYECERLALKSFFIDNDIKQTKQYFYECGMLDEVIVSKYKGHILEYELAHIGYVLLSDNINLIKRYARLTQEDYDNTTKGSIIHAIQLAITDQLSQDYINTLSKKKGQSAIKPDVLFFESLLNRDKAGCELAINHLLTSRRHNHRNQNMPLTKEFISHPAIGYAKLAWLKGVQVEIDNPLVPFALLPISPNAKYDDKFSSFKE